MNSECDGWNSAESNDGFPDKDGHWHLAEPKSSQPLAGSLPLWLLLLFLIQPLERLFAQSADEGRPVEAEFGLVSTVSSERHQAFWLVHNRHGWFDEGSANLLGRGTVRKRLQEEGRASWGAGATFLARRAGHSTGYFHEAWLEGRYEFLTLEAGLREQTHGTTFESLTSGSTGLSRNASPLPRIAIAVRQFTPVPYTAGWLEFRGHFSHGWMTGDRIIRDTFLHDKSFYLQTGGETGLKFYVGLLHFAEWGGVTAEGREFPASFGDFLRVVTADEGDDRAHGIDRANALGAHTGIWDWGLKAALGEAELNLYYQHLFTDNSGLVYRNLRDGLYGVAVSNPFGTDLVTAILWEFLYTKHQTGPGLTDPMPGDSPWFCEEINPNCGYRYNGRDDYYNNGVYLDGWSHRSRALGSPLFLTQVQLDRVRPGIDTYSDRFFTSTRVVAHHVGLEGWLHQALSYRALATWSRHYGTYWGLNLGEPWGSLDPENDPESYFFNPPQEQWYLMLETDWQTPWLDQLSLHTAIGLDRGDLFQNSGVMVGLNWRLLP